jgi:membrane fusion protein (multidrug efflux system)
MFRGNPAAAANTSLAMLAQAARNDVDTSRPAVYPGWRWTRLGGAGYVAALSRRGRKCRHQGCSTMDFARIGANDARSNRPPITRRFGRPRSAVCALLGALLLPFPLTVSAPAQQTAPAAVPVGIVVAERKPIARTVDFVGRIQAVERVDIQARVTGYLEQVLFTEGDRVKEGQPLYRIEKDLFKAAVEQAKGALEASKAKKLLTAIQYERAEQLMKTSSGTVVARDQALTADRSAAAQILIDQANLDSAETNLAYTDINAPIAGRIGRTTVTKGNVVGPQSGTLTTIVSVDPIYVLFPVSQRALMQARKEAQAADIAGIKVRLRFADGSTYGASGKIDFVDVTVDKATDTVQVRAVFPNQAGELIDGQLVTVDLEIGTPQEQVVVPQAALITDQQGVYVFVVEDGKAAIRRIKTGGADGRGVIVTQGLAGGEQVVVEGIQSLRPGMAVRASPVAPELGRG